MDHEELSDRLYLRTEVCFRRAEIYFARQFRRASLSYVLASPALGQFNGLHNTIKYNVDLALATNPEYFLDNIPAHEVAHAIIHELYSTNRDVHGPEWQRIMVDAFGVEARPTYPELQPQVQPVALLP